MNWNGYYEGNALQQVIIGANDNGAGRMVPGGNAWKFMNMSGSINPACRSAIDPTGTNSSEHWRCLLAENAARHITSRIFPLEQLWGVFGSFCLVNSVCETTTMLSRFALAVSLKASMSVVNDSAFDTGLHCDMGGRAGHSMHACVEYGWECSDVQFTALVLPYQQHVLQSFASLPFLSRPGNGAFMHSCHLGDEDMLGVFFNSIRVLPSNTTAQQRLSQWWKAGPSAAPLWEPPCLWNTSFTPPRVYAHNCNPSCPNIAYMKEKQALRSGRGATAAAREE